MFDAGIVANVEFGVAVLPNEPLGILAEDDNVIFLVVVVAIGVAGKESPGIVTDGVATLGSMEAIGFVEPSGTPDPSVDNVDSLPLDPVSPNVLASFKLPVVVVSASGDRAGEFDEGSESLLVGT